MANDQGLVLSVDAKPRLKWTPQLHEQFVDAVTLLGGAGKATPKSVMRVMGMPGLTLYHLKSHLQKYRLAKNRDLKSTNNGDEQDCVLADSMASENGTGRNDGEQSQSVFNESMLQMQMEVQRKLQEQLEVQKHLQLRIEAQGKYLQSVLMKAEETLKGYRSNSMGADAAKAELSELVSAVDAQCQSSSVSGHSVVPKRDQRADCSTDSCLTSSERPETKDGKRRKLYETSSSSYKWIEESDVTDRDCRCNDYQGKRSFSGNCEEACVQQSTTCKRLMHRTENGYGMQEELDLNR